MMHQIIVKLNCKRQQHFFGFGANSEEYLEPLRTNLPDNAQTHVLSFTKMLWAAGSSNTWPQNKQKSNKQTNEEQITFKK